jgi:hypothetical protein
MTTARTQQLLEDTLDALGVDWTAQNSGSYAVVLPGEQRLSTTVNLRVREHSVRLEAFFARQPDENHEQVYRWLLRSNAKHPLVSFAIDDVGDIYLVGQVPLAAIDADFVDRWLGVALSVIDSSFNTVLAMGFASSIREEWAWRLARGESTANLAAFTSLRPTAESDDHA